MRHEATIGFDELTLPDGSWFAVYGKADISATLDEYGNVEDWRVESIILDNGEKNLLTIDDRHALWRPICEALAHPKDWIENRIFESASEEFTFRDLDAERSADYRAAVL